jgi:glycosyltransferase involved in cell wall biosynthesis
MPEAGRVAIVAARNEAKRIGATLDALRSVLPRARLIVADDASADATAEIAMQRGAWVISRGRRHGKGGNVGAAAEAAIGEFGDRATVLLCDADLGESATQLAALAASVEADRCDLAIAGFVARDGGGFGLVVGYARSRIRRLTGFSLAAPLSGQRAMRISTLRSLLPFAEGWGLEVGMTIDALRLGARVEEIELPLGHRVTGRTPAGFLHRGRQLRDVRRAVRARR